MTNTAKRYPPRGINLRPWRLYAAAALCNVSLRDLARAVGCCAAHLYGVGRGDSRVSAALMARIGERLGPGAVDYCTGASDVLPDPPEHLRQAPAAQER